MALIINSITFAIILTTTNSLEPLYKGDVAKPLNKVVQLLYKTNIDRRADNLEYLNKAKAHHNLLKHAKTKKREKGFRDSQILRTDVDKNGEVVENDRGKLIEDELKTSLSEKKSALDDRPFIEQEGKVDFLVMRPNINDPFVTVIPNSIYLGIEKKCVNWLDDCSLKGIRARLLREVRSPYR